MSRLLSNEVPDSGPEVADVGLQSRAVKLEPAESPGTATCWGTAQFQEHAGQLWDVPLHQPLPSPSLQGLLKSRLGLVMPALRTLGSATLEKLALETALALGTRLTLRREHFCTYESRIAEILPEVL